MAIKPEARTLTVALAGAPNVGKSTVFNLLTGLSQHVGNWPGKTIEQKTGVFHRDDLIMNLVDLPGTYSLTANSPEEQIARDYLVQEKPDVVVAVLNAASLERNLYLVAELIELSPRLVIALNMTDVASQQGIKTDAGVLSKALDIPVVPIVASKNQGIDELVTQIEFESLQPQRSREDKHVEFGKEVKNVIRQIEALLPDNVTTPYPKHWAAMKLLEGDSQIIKLIKGRMAPTQWPGLDAFLKENESAAMVIATLRFEWIGRMLAAAQVKPPVGRVSLTEKLDHVALHPFYGIVVLLAILGGIFMFVYSIGIPLQSFLEANLIDTSRHFIQTNLSQLPGWLQSLLGDGILGGAGTVLTFLPVLFFFFLAWALLEDVGYTTRAAFVTDRFMHRLGLHGKSVLPLVMGFGCNVPSILGTRIIESPRARLLTILLAPLVPCTGRMTVIALIAAAFFGTQAILVSLIMVLFSLFMLVITGLILNRFVIRGDSGSLIMELPLYHLPNMRTIGLVSGQNTMAFVKRAGTVILAVSLVVWALSSFPGGNIESSFLAQIGKLLEPAGRLMGLNWQMMVALFSSFVAKENTIATLGILFSEQGVSLTTQLQAALTIPAALAFLVFQALFIPCVATVAAIRHETGSLRWPIFSIIIQLVLSFSMAIIVFQVARLLID